MTLDEITAIRNTTRCKMPMKTHEGRASVKTVDLGKFCTMQVLVYLSVYYQKISNELDTTKITKLIQQLFTTSALYQITFLNVSLKTNSEAKRPKCLSKSGDRDVFGERNVHSKVRW